MPAQIIDKEEKIDISLAKGLGIFLVVVGHILARGKPLENEWFLEVVNIIYLFHMPFFMVLSGYVFFRPGRVENLWQKYPSFIKKQAVRLLVPFFIMGFIVLFGKIIAAQVMYVDNKPQSILDGIAGLFWETDKSPSTFIWYVFVLFVYTAFAPLLVKVFPAPLVWATIFGMGLYTLPLVEYAYLDKLTPYFLFFAIGGLLRQHDKCYLSLIDRYLFVFLAIFIVSLIIPYTEALPHQYFKLIAGVASIPALHGVCRFFMNGENLLIKGMYYLGHHTLVIYLFNTICIGITKGVMFKVVSWDGLNFLFYMPILIAAGIIGPLIILKIWEYFSRKISTF